MCPGLGLATHCEVLVSTSGTVQWVYTLYSVHYTLLVLQLTQSRVAQGRLLPVERILRRLNLNFRSAQQTNGLQDGSLAKTEFGDTSSQWEGGRLKVVKNLGKVHLSYQHPTSNCQYSANNVGSQYWPWHWGTSSWCHCWAAMTCPGGSSGLIIVALREENNNFHIDAIERVPIYFVISVFLN